MQRHFKVRHNCCVSFFVSTLVSGATVFCFFCAFNKKEISKAGKISRQVFEELTRTRKNLSQKDKKGFGFVCKIFLMKPCIYNSVDRPLRRTLVLLVHHSANEKLFSNIIYIYALLLHACISDEVIATQGTMPCIQQFVPKNFFHKKSCYMNRRNFIKNTSLATAGITILNFPVFGKNAPSNKIVVAVMGVNSRGAYLSKCYSQLQNVEVAYICDVEEKAIANGFDALKDAPRKPTLVKDIRDLVTKKDFDALIIAAPDHWHTPAAILGVSHDKHVYFEKASDKTP